MIFRLDSAKQEAALLTAKRKIAEVDAAMLAAQADIIKAEGQLQEAKGSLQQAPDELDTKRELQKRNPGIVPQRDIEKLAGGRCGPSGHPRRRHRFQTVRDDPRQRAAAGGESKRRGGAGRSAGRSGQDLHSRRCRRAGRAVRAEAGRYRQSDDTDGRRPDSGGRGTASLCRRGLGRSRLRS